MHWSKSRQTELVQVNCEQFCAQLGVHTYSGLPALYARMIGDSKLGAVEFAVPLVELVPPEAMEPPVEVLPPAPGAPPVELPPPEL